MNAALSEIISSENNVNMGLMRSVTTRQKAVLTLNSDYIGRITAIFQLRVV